MNLKNICIFLLLCNLYQCQKAPKQHIWQVNLESPPLNFLPVFKDSFLLLNTSGAFFCIDTANGNILWKKQHNDCQPYITLGTNECFLYNRYEDSCFLYGVNYNSGEFRKLLQIPKRVDGFLLKDSDSTVVATCYDHKGNIGLHKFNIYNKELYWYAPNLLPFGACIDVDSTILFSRNDTSVYHIYKKTGKKAAFSLSPSLPFLLVQTGDTWRILNTTTQKFDTTLVLDFAVAHGDKVYGVINDHRNFYEISLATNTVTQHFPIPEKVNQLSFSTPFIYFYYNYKKGGLLDLRTMKIKEKELSNVPYDNSKIYMHGNRFFYYTRDNYHSYLFSETVLNPD